MKRINIKAKTVYLVFGVALGMAVTIIFYLNLSLSVTRYTLSGFLIFSVAGVIAFVGLAWYSNKLKNNLNKLPVTSIQHLLDSYLSKHAKEIEIDDNDYQSIKRITTESVKYIISMIATLRAFGFVFASITIAVSAAILIATLMQVERLDQQNQLAEASRRAALINELTAILTEIDEELDNSENPNEKMSFIENPEPGKSPTFISEGTELSKRLVWRIVALSRSLQPYRFLQDNNLTSKPYSPERAQLLVSLVASGINLKDVFRMGSFDYSYLKDAELGNIFLRDTKLRNSNFEGANLITSDLSDSYLGNSNFRNSILFNVPMNNADIRGVDFTGARMTESFHLSGAHMSGVILDGAFVSSPSWIKEITELKEPPLNFDSDTWVVSKQPADYFVKGQELGLAYRVSRR
ncbi:MAG: pentapeptide repeat-containing protein [Candidatus Thiodiazotropha sp. L084R]